MSTKSDIFDRLASQSASKQDIFDKLALEQPSRARSIASAYPKGVAKGTVDLASFFQTLPGLGGQGPVPAEFMHQQLNKILPTQETVTEKVLERAGKLTPSLIGGPEGLLAKGVRTGAGALLGQAAEEAGAPESVQNLAELLAFMSPKFGKELLPKKSQKEAVEFLRSKGLTDKEITPLLQSERKLKYLSKVAKGEGKAEKLSGQISEKLGKEYEALKEKPSFMKNEDVTKFDNSLQDVMDKINPRFSRLMENDLKDLRNKGISAENLINFYQDINAVVKGQEGGKAVLGKLKEPIIEGLKKIDPKIASDFENLNKFYSKNKQFYKSIKPGQFDKYISKGKIYALIGALSTLDFKKAAYLLGAQELGSRVAREVLINPRLQNLSNQMLKSIKNNNLPLTQKLFELYQKELDFPLLEEKPSPTK